MMEKKEYHRANLPHFQQPGQAYFVTWSLSDAVPPKALKEYTDKLNLIREQILYEKHHSHSPELISSLQFEYNILRKKFIKAYEDVLHLRNKSVVDLSKPDNTQIVISALCFWQGRKLQNYAICVMPNHVHWVFRLYVKDMNEREIWLEDILQSVKQYSSREINLLEGRHGTLWHKESWDTTIRDNRHLYEAIEYTKNNPVVAGLVKEWQNWKGTKLYE